MEKPILATTIRDVIINGSVWEEAHYLWYDEKEKELKKKNLDTKPIKEWKKLLRTNPEEEKKNYFRYVDKIMEILHPNLSKEKRTKSARKSYFNSVIKFLEQNPDKVNHEFLEYLERLKDKYRIAIITTNTYSALEKIISVTGINKYLFDLIETSKPEEKDDKKIVFERFVKKYGKPEIYIGANRESVDYWEEKGVKSILTDFYSNSGLPNSIINIKELKEKLN